MEKKINPLDFFQQRLYAYLKDYQPQKLKDEDVKEFIILRAEAAQDAYSESTLRGAPHYGAMAEANAVLMEGLEFSPVSFIQEVYEEVKRDILDDDKALDIYYKAKDLFENCNGEFEEVEEEVRLKEQIACFL